MEFQKGDIVVVTKETRYSCGAIRGREGAIVRIVTGVIDEWGYIEVWRCVEDERDYLTFRLPVVFLRQADVKENIMYVDGVRNIK
jgi:hypothetical protein